eukprot:NODE_653_length_1426_cov_370.363968.p2 GENE.NODE_653_length_1426_cov_370.363968~~NODE_653_length_1426_cov_370.363968.p2  ORF type:complete len:385 (-),score=127.04 NODE_653_length_1426_cov_370.363968:255-1334(-)
MADVVKPFHIEIDVLNKEEVIKGKVPGFGLLAAAANHLVTEEKFATKIAEKLHETLPGAMKEAGIDLTIERCQNEGPPTHFSLSLQVRGLDMAGLGKTGLKLNEADAARFAAAFAGIQQSLRRMGMEEKADGISSGIGDKVRNALMVKLQEILPQKLGDQGVKIKVEVPEYVPSAATPPPADGPHPSKLGLNVPFYLECTIEDRKALLSEALPGGGIAAGAKRCFAGWIPDDKFSDVVEQKLSEKIPAALYEKAGVRTTIVSEAPNAERESAISVKVTIEGFDTVQLLTTAKGPEFGAGFGELWNCLQELASLGIPGLEEKMDGITETIAGNVREKMREKLAEVLGEKLHARVAVTDAW